MMANQLSLNMQDTGRDILKVSLEMPIEQEIIRILANQTGIQVAKIKNKKLTKEERLKVKEGYTKFVLKAKKIKNRLSIISPNDDMSMRQVLMQAKPYNYDVIIIDYISLLAEEPGVEMWKHLSNIARQAKQFTMANKCLIILLAQLDEDSNKVRYSRAIKEHCDVMWTWHVTDADRENNKMTVNQTKGRNDGLLSFEVDVAFDQMRIRSDSSSSHDSGSFDERTSDISDLMG
jgi:replicative DNA helicase